MKCPKCGYIGFEPSDRCRNCGFDFSLAPAEQPASDLPLRQTRPTGPLADFDLGEAGPPPRVTTTARGDRRRQDPSLDPGVPRVSEPPRIDAADLPLFGGEWTDDAPLVRPAAPIAPLAVRRSTPSRPRSTPAPRVSDRPSDLSLPLDSATPLSTAGSSLEAPRAPGDDDVAPLGPRFGAAAVDWLLLLALDAGVVYFTLRVSRLAATQIGLLPVAPLAAFLVLLNGGYLALFTAATGQTIGKMAFGLRVVSAEGEALPTGRALIRVLALIVSALPAGLGLIPAGFDRSRRGLHDRLADTVVVRAASS
jgi:uncharacterized RDD family membrane protein YckC